MSTKRFHVGAPAVPSERTHRIWHAQRLLSRRPSASGPRRAWHSDMALEFIIGATIAKKLEMKRCGFHKILGFAGSATPFESPTEPINAMFLVALNQIGFNITTIDQYIFAISIPLIKFNVC